MVQYEDVTSSNIRAVGFEKGTGYVWFTNGRRFAYTMTKALFGDMKSSASIGGFFARMVKGKCPVVWNGWACDSSPCRSNASLHGAMAGMVFRVCEPCSKIARFEGVEFSPIPEEKP